ncbi:MAG: hypothetical protein HN742_37225 [Lentisphaerae bacterium]|jgi:hypothetical protein|nr:hypothetical protein [Lentisphaerota bacterium]MBT5604326.1 hypothetical protein [Lentisphaerota bacterium]MBT7060263.1 hypothetical protein [Lentisphaerota bacterium]MBT7847570.1 hypothetical protein [Lentisphaerota bacterium]
MPDAQDHLRGDGTLPIIAINADNLAEAAHKAIIACYDQGARIETPKQKPGMSLGYDADMIVRVADPDSDPRIDFGAIVEDGRGVMQYILEVTHGIHNHWKKSPEEPHFWGYTYNERFVDQLPFIFQRIKADWDEKAGQWGDGKGRPSGRDYQFLIWRAGEDIILEQDDPPCWQRGQIRLLKNQDGDLVLNYITDWRSRDLAKAWNENNVAQVELMKLFRAKISDVLGVEVKLGAYIDRASSLHLYGLYFDRDGLEQSIQRMRDTPYEQMSMALEDYYSLPDGDDAESLKRLIAAQTDAEAKGHGKNASKHTLIGLGYDLANFPYPDEWNTWPKSWDEEPNIEMLARVLP